MQKDHLIPAKKGEIRNPWGKQPGTPNRSTIAQLVLSMKGIPPEEIMRNLERMYPDYFKRKGEKFTNELLATLRLAQKAIIKADVRAYEAIMDSAYGKAKQAVELSEAPDFIWEDDETT